MNLRLTTCALLVLGNPACNVISGANEIVFTGSPNGGNGGGGGAASSGSNGDAGGGGFGGGGANGSGGGSNVSDGPYAISCPSDTVIVGLYGRSGLWLDRIGLLCAPINSDGTLGPPMKTDTAGGDGGSAMEVTCPINESLVGIDRWTSEMPDPPLVYGIDLRCQTLAEWKKPGASTHVIPGIGSHSGSLASLVCPTGFTHFKVDGDAGGWNNYIGTFVLTAKFMCFEYP
jgi:hypothetical protein